MKTPNYTSNLIQQIERLKAENQSLKESKWISVKERPLVTVDGNGRWECTDDGDCSFIAAVPYKDNNQPKWWVRHCVIEHETGLCVVGDEDSEPCGWQINDITHWQPLPTPPTT